MFNNILTIFPLVGGALHGWEEGKRRTLSSFWLHQGDIIHIYTYIYKAFLSFGKFPVTCLTIYETELDSWPIDLISLPSHLFIPEAKIMQIVNLI